MQQRSNQDLSHKKTAYQKVGYWIAALFFLLVAFAIIYAFLLGV
ncbi:hypothetical protein [Sporolactobacillus spathodeae]|uniref:Uncharacterized protein n=1 Tax=Sporolactobacillus spathodeae TaxID=1465502 RepID=A0ABS2Q6K6_9BACL|nr:hypothetical protein [Sporolactobacillus spathodeae]MBM7657358.1 hypothetical protein [Sporolactobacillus spathodeae]